MHCKGVTMDLGRLAFQRVEELENALRQAPRERVRNTGLSVRPNFFINAQNPYRLTTASGRGRQSLLVKINAVVETVGRIAIMLNNQKLGFTDFNALGNQEQVLMLSARIAGESAAITLVAQNDFRANLVSVQAVLIGDNANLSRRSGDFAVDESGEFLGVLYSKNETLTLARYDLMDLSEYTNFNIGMGGISDLCGDGAGGFYVSFIDNSQNFWVVHIGYDGAERRIQINQSDTASITSVAVFFTEHEQELTVAFTKNNRVFSLKVAHNLSSSTQGLPLEDERADAVDFVKRATSSTLLSTRQGRIFVRKPIKGVSLLRIRVNLRGLIGATTNFDLI